MSLLKIPFSSLFLLIFLNGCGSAERRMEQAEQKFDTDGPIRHLFHSSLYYPQEISLQFDGYILGVEKAPKSKILNGELATFERPEAGIGGRNNAASHLDDDTIMFVSHILKQNSGLRKNCAVYNAYADLIDSKLLPLVDYCNTEEKPAINYGVPGKAFENSWGAMKILGDSIKNDLNDAKKDYTHIVVVTMGWNTDQIEAVRNINSVVGGIEHAHLTSAVKKSRFSPLVIGVTWPSMWVSPYLDPIVKFASFRTKADDADELGLTWLGVLLHNTLPYVRATAKKTIPIIAIGHSFGSRASITGACVGPIIYNKAQGGDDLRRDQLGEIDHLINLQGAFLTKQLLEPGSNKLSFPNGCTHVKNLVITSSKKDTANSLPSYIPGWGYYAGDDRSYSKYCHKNETASGIECATATETGVVELPALRSNILLVNADSLITEQAFGSGGGAHSDIYRKEHGVLIHRVISRLPASFTSSSSTSDRKALP